MMEAGQLVPGLVVYDEAAQAPPQKRYFRVLECRDVEIGPWVLEQVAGQHRRTVALPALEHFRMVDATKLERLVGAQVRMQLTFGTSVSGVLESLEYHAVMLDGALTEIATGFMVDSELYPVNQVEVLDVE